MSKKQRECNKKDSVVCLPSDRWGVGGCFREELSLSGTGLQNDTLRRADFLLLCFSVDLADLPPTNNKYITYPLIQNKNQETNQNYSKYLYICFFKKWKAIPNKRFMMIWLLQRFFTILSTCMYSAELDLYIVKLIIIFWAKMSFPVPTLPYYTNSESFKYWTMLSH